ncbi:MAG TPA: carbohydrate porin [Polyangia bacterium]
MPPADAPFVRGGRPRGGRAAVVALFAGAVVLAAPSGARARHPEQPETAPRPGGDLTFLDHGGPGPFWYGAEINAIFQTHPSFRAPYSGQNSLKPGAERALSWLVTAFGAYTPTSTTELILDPEIALGSGLSQAVGAAGFPNLDVVRNPTLSHAPYIARVEVHQIIPLSSDWVPNEDRGPISSLALVPRHRLELRFGKMSTADLFDVNPAGSDSHLQFMNWTVDNNGAYDYAADTRGYTWAFVAEYQGPRLEVRLGEMLMPKVANGIDLDWDVTDSRADNLELEIKYAVAEDWRGTLRVLGYQNHANMGSYREAVAAAGVAGTLPDVTATRRAGRVKRGFGLNAFQELGGAVRVFGRFGWSGGQLESFAFTEVENTLELGADLAGATWRRPTDRVGFAFVSNGLSAAHADYLSKGGRGFLLGDGRLTYARETIVEHYYNLHVWRGLFFAEDVQLLANPGYNADRGPVWVFSLRGHIEI